MKEYLDFPPQRYFLRVLKNCPKSALLYSQLWKRRDKHMMLKPHKKDIRKDYLISPTLFRNLLAPLMFLNLVSFVEGEGKFQIELSGQTNEQ